MGYWHYKQGMRLRHFIVYLCVFQLYVADNGAILVVL